MSVFNRSMGFMPGAGGKRDGGDHFGGESSTERAPRRGDDAWTPWILIRQFTVDS